MSCQTMWVNSHIDILIHAGGIGYSTVHNTEVCGNHDASYSSVYLEVQYFHLGCWYTKHNLLPTSTDDSYVITYSILEENHH